MYDRMSVPGSPLSTVNCVHLRLGILPRDNVSPTPATELFRFLVLTTPLGSISYLMTAVESIFKHPREDMPYGIPAPIFLAGTQWTIIAGANCRPSHFYAQISKRRQLSARSAGQAITCGRF